MFKTVIWATDGSDAADAALPMVEEFGGSADRLIVLHSDELLAGRSGGLPMLADEDELRQKIAGQAQEMRERGLAAELRIIDGVGARAAHVIADVAAHENADLIIVGTRGMGPTKGLLRGSVTQRLLHLAPCVVLAVPPAGRKGGREHAQADTAASS